MQQQQQIQVGAPITAMPTPWHIRRMILLPVISDLVIIVCLFVWLNISTYQYYSHVDPCEEDHLYSVGSSVQCVDRGGCQSDIHCRVTDSWFGEGDDSSCDNNDCVTDNCSCVPSTALLGLFLSYTVFFMVAMGLETIKAGIVILTSMFGQCCCGETEHDPMDKVCLRHTSDSWTVFLLMAFNSKRYQEMVKSIEEGRLGVVTWLKVIQWVFRDFILGVIILLYIPKVHYFNGWFVVFLVALLLYMFGLWRRMQHVAAIRHTNQINNPMNAMGGVQMQPVVRSVPMQQQPQPYYGEAPFYQTNQPQFVVYGQQPQPMGIQAYPMPVPNETQEGDNTR